jgi:hypothetical protein
MYNKIYHNIHKKKYKTLYNNKKVSYQYIYIFKKKYYRIYKVLNTI